MISLRNFCSYLSFAAVIALNTILMADSQATSEIKLVNVVFRHGDRTPDNNGFEMYPNDPYLNYSFYPTGLGQLTLKGKRNEYRLGQNIRARYSNYLGKIYIPREVVARSSDYDRTKMSLQLVLAGLYPPQTRVQRWHRTLNWQPIPASYVPRVEDNLILADECPEYLEEYERVLQSREVLGLMSQFQDLRSNLTKLTGKQLDRPLDYYFLYHTFVAESSLGLPLPEWVYNYFPKGQLFDAIVASYDISSKTNKLRRYFAGPLIRAMTENMINRQNGASPAKIHLYSGHESNIAALLQAFQLFEPHVPEYSSAIFMELHEIGSNYYVKLVYYKGIPPVVQELTIPGCTLLCPFDKFLDLTADLIPADGEVICNKRKTPDYANVPYSPAVQEMMYNMIKSRLSNSNQ